MPDRRFALAFTSLHHPQIALRAVFRDCSAVAFLGPPGGPQNGTALGRSLKNYWGTIFAVPKSGPPGGPDFGVAKLPFGQALCCFQAPFLIPADGFLFPNTSKTFTTSHATAAGASQLSAPKDTGSDCQTNYCFVPPSLRCWTEQGRSSGAKPERALILGAKTGAVKPHSGPGMLIALLWQTPAQAEEQHVRQVPARRCLRTS